MWRSGHWRQCVPLRLKLQLQVIFEIRNGECALLQHLQSSLGIPGVLATDRSETWSVSFTIRVRTRISTTIWLIGWTCLCNIQVSISIHMSKCVNYKSNMWTIQVLVLHQQQQKQLPILQRSITTPNIYLNVCSFVGSCRAPWTLCGPSADLFYQSVYIVDR